MCFICYVQVFLKWQQFIFTCSFNSYSAFITLKMYIKKVTSITAKICALICFNYTASHLLSIEIIIFKCKNKK